MNCTCSFAAATTFSNSYRSFSRIQGRDGTIENYGGEGASLFLLTNEGGNRKVGRNPTYTAPPGMGLEENKPEIVHVPNVTTMWTI